MTYSTPAEGNIIVSPSMTGHQTLNLFLPYHRDRSIRSRRQGTKNRRCKQASSMITLCRRIRGVAEERTRKPIYSVGVGVTVTMTSLNHREHV